MGKYKLEITITAESEDEAKTVARWLLRDPDLLGESFTAKIGRFHLSEVSDGYNYPGTKPGDPGYMDEFTVNALNKMGWILQRDSAALMAMSNEERAAYYDKMRADQRAEVEAHKGNAG